MLSRLSDAISVCVHAAAAFSLDYAASHDALPADVAEDKVCSGCMMCQTDIPAPVAYVVGFLGPKAGHSVKKADFVNLRAHEEDCAALVPYDLPLLL